jgi:hypothetical protein
VEQPDSAERPGRCGSPANEASASRQALANVQSCADRDEHRDDHHHVSEVARVVKHQPVLLHLDERPAPGRRQSNRHNGNNTEGCEGNELTHAFEMPTGAAQTTGGSDP